MSQDACVQRGGRIEEHIQLLQYKLKLIDEGVAFRGKRTKIARSQGKKFHVSIEQERSRLLGNLAWANMQQNNYQTAEELYRKALSIEPDKNKQCNLAICLMHGGRITEAKSLLQALRPSSTDRESEDSYIKSFDRAFELLIELDSQSDLNQSEQEDDGETEIERSFTSPIKLDLKSQVSSFEGDELTGFGSSICRRRYEENNSKEPLLLEDFSNNSVVKWERESYSGSLLENGADSSGFEKGRGRGGTETEVEQISGWQALRRPSFVYKWKKASHSPNTFRKGSDISSFENGRWVSENRTEEGGETFLSPFSINKNSDSQFSINRDWRLGGDEYKKQSVTESSLNPKMLIESPVPNKNLGAMAAASKLGGCLPASMNGNWNQMSMTTVSCSMSDNVCGKNTHKVQDVTDCITGNSNMTKDFSIFRSQKSWADMVEEEEEEFLCECIDLTPSKWEYSSQDSSVSFQTPSKWDDGFRNENSNSNIISPSPHPPTSTCSMSRTPSHMHRRLPQNHTEILQRKLKVVDLKESTSVKKTGNCSSARRSLFFHHDQKVPAEYYCPSPFQKKKAFKFENYNYTVPTGVGYTCGKDSESVRKGNRRLQVFQDITLPDSPRA